jgi:hypothetical protein
MPTGKLMLPEDYLTRANDAIIGYDVITLAQMIICSDIIIPYHEIVHLSR